MCWPAWALAASPGSCSSSVNKDHAHQIRMIVVQYVYIIIIDSQQEYRSLLPLQIFQKVEKSNIRSTLIDLPSKSSEL